MYVMQIAALESEVARLQKINHELVSKSNSYVIANARLEEQNAALRAEVEGMREDAERYRWLRSDSRVGRWMVMQWLPHLGRYERVSEEKINEYIDSERKK